eukprot:c25258_g3_i1 orf=457-927(+)
MVDTCTVGLTCGVSLSHERVIPSLATSLALHQHGLANPVINQLLPPFISHTSSSERLNQFLLPHFQCQKLVEDFTDLKNGNIELVRGSRGANSTTINITEVNATPINVFEPDASSWGSVIFGNVRTGQDTQALELYLKMRSVDVEPDSLVFVAVLK